MHLLESEQGVVAMTMTERVFWQSGHFFWCFIAKLKWPQGFFSPIDLKMARISNQPGFCSLPFWVWKIQGIHWFLPLESSMDFNKSLEIHHHFPKDLPAIPISWYGDDILWCISCLRVVVPYSVWRQFFSIDSSILSTFEPIKMYKQQYVWSFRIDIHKGRYFRSPFKTTNYDWSTYPLIGLY